jgi:hypothetical protein
MEPLDEKELSYLLRKWEAPEAPPSLKRRVFPGRRLSWRWLFTGTIRVPVPVGVAAIVLVVIWIYYFKPTTTVPVAQPAGTVSLVDFQPVRQLEPVVVAGGQR